MAQATPQRWSDCRTAVDHTRFSACTRKTAYPTLEAADADAKPTQVSYRCGFCAAWHHTSRRTAP